MAQSDFWDKAPEQQNQTYQDPADVMMETTGRSLLASMPPPIWGARGIVVPSAGAGGAPPGFNPNVAPRAVIVDADIPGEGFVVDLSQISKEQMAAATAAADVGGAQTPEERRYRASEALRQFAVAEKAASAQPARRSTREAPVNLPGLYVIPETPTAPPMQAPLSRPQGMPPQAPFAPPPPQAATQRPAPMLQPTALQQAPVPSLFQRPGMASATAAAPPAAPSANPVVGPPTIKVLLEVRGSPLFPQEVYYHHVQRHEDTLLLAFDRRAAGYPLTFPRAGDATLAVCIDGQDVVYLTRVAVERRPFLDWDICILQITEEYPVQS